MSSRTKQGETTLAYLAKYPDMSNHGLSRVLHKEHPALYSSAKLARDSVCYYRGVKGKRALAKVAVKDFVLPKPTTDNPLSLPASYRKPYEPYIIGPTLKRLLILADIHCPYHNIEALTLAIQDGVAFKADCIILNGDTMDCHAISRYERDPEARSFAQELEAIRQLLSVLRTNFPKAKIIYKEGNHERRYQAYLRRHAAELIGCDIFELSSLLNFWQYKVDWVGDRRPIKLGKLNIMHGDEWTQSTTSPVNPARTTFMRAMSCAVSSHNHQTSEHSQPTLDGHLISCWSTGTLGELHPQFMPLNKWNLGFAKILRGDDDQFTVFNHKIIKGKIY